MKNRLIKLCYEKNDESLFLASKLLRTLFDYSNCYSLSEWYVDEYGLEIKKENIPCSQVKCIILLGKDSYKKYFSNYDVCIDYEVHGNFYGHIVNDNVTLFVFNDELTSEEIRDINARFLCLLQMNDKKFYNNILSQMDNDVHTKRDYHRTFLLLEYFFNKFMKENQLT